MAAVLRSDRALRTVPERPRDADEARARLAALVPHVAPGSLALERNLPVHESLTSLLPHGVPRASIVSCTGPTAVSSALLVVAAASQAGTWIGVAGCPWFSAQAAAEVGVEIGRVLMVRPGARDDDEAAVLGALVDGVEIVLLGAAARVRPAVARRLQSRLATREAVLVVVGDPGPFSADLRLAGRGRWHGLGDGHGHLRAREVELVVDGRRVPRPRRDTLWFPDAAGRITGRRTVVRPAPSPMLDATPDAPVSTVAVRTG